MANVFANLIRPVPTVLDYMGQMEELDRSTLQRQQAMQQMQERTRALQQAEQERNALTGLIRQSGGDQNKLIGLLESSGVPSFYAQAQGYRKAGLEARKVETDIAKDAATAAKAQGETLDAALKRYRGMLDQVQNPQQAAQWMQAQYADPQVGAVVSRMGPIEQAISSIPQDPQGFAQWRERSAMGMEKFIANQTQIRGQDMGAETTRRGQDLSAATQRRGQDIAAATSRRGQDLVDARTREMTAVTKDDARARREAEKTEAGVQKYSATLQKDGIPEIEAALSGAEGIFKRYADPKTGKVGSVPGIGAITNVLPDWAVSSEGKDVRESLQSVANIVLAARSGAAVTDQELRRLARELSNSLGSSAEDMQRAYGKFRARFEIVKANAAAGVSDDVKDVYEQRGGVKIQRGGAKPPEQPAGLPSMDAIEAELRRRQGK